MLWPHWINNWSLNLLDLGVIGHPWVLSPSLKYPAPCPARRGDSQLAAKSCSNSLPLWGLSESLRQHPFPFWSVPTLDTFLLFVYSVTDPTGFINHLLCASQAKAPGTEWRIRQIRSPRTMVITGTDDFKSINSWLSMKECIAYGNLSQRGHVIWGLRRPPLGINV